MSNPGSGDKFRSDLGPARKDLSFTNPEDTGDLEQFVNRLRDFAGAHNSVALLRDVIYNPNIKPVSSAAALSEARRLLAEEVKTLTELGVKVGKEPLTAKEFVERIIKNKEAAQGGAPWLGSGKDYLVYDGIIPGYDVAMSESDPDTQEAVKCAYVARIIKSQREDNVYYVKYNKVRDHGGIINADTALEGMPPIRVSKSENGTFEFTATILEPQTLTELDDASKIQRYGNHALLNLQFNLGSKPDTKWRMITGDTLFNLAQRVDQFKNKKVPRLVDSRQQLVVPSWLGTGTGKSWIQGIGAALWGSGMSILPDTNLRAEQTSEYVASICVTTGLTKDQVKPLVYEGIPADLLIAYQSPDAATKDAAKEKIEAHIKKYPFITMTTDEFVIVKDLLVDQYLLFDEAHTLEKDEYFEALQKVAEKNLCFLMTATPRSKLISYCKEIGANSIYTYTLGHAFEEGNVRSVEVAPLSETTLDTGMQAPATYDSPEMKQQIEQLTDQAAIEFFSKSMLTSEAVKGHTMPGPEISKLLREGNFAKEVEQPASRLKRMQMTFSKTAAEQKQRYKGQRADEAKVIAGTIRSIVKKNEARLAFEKGFMFSSDPHVRALMADKYNLFYDKASDGGAFLSDVSLKDISGQDREAKMTQLKFIAHCYSASLTNHMQHDQTLLQDPEVQREIKAKYLAESKTVIGLIRQEILSEQSSEREILEKMIHRETLSDQELNTIEKPLMSFSQSMRLRLAQTREAHVRSAVVSEISGRCLGIDSKNMLEEYQFGFAGEGVGAAQFLKKQVFSLLQKDDKSLLSHFRSPDKYEALLEKVKDSYFGDQGSFNALDQKEQLFLWKVTEEQMRRFLVMVNKIDAFSLLAKGEIPRIDDKALKLALETKDDDALNTMADSILFRLINPNMDVYLKALNEEGLLRDHIVNMIKNPELPMPISSPLESYVYTGQERFTAEQAKSYLSQSVVLNEIDSYSLPQEHVVQHVHAKLPADTSEQTINTAKQRLRLGLCMTAISDHTFSTGLSIADATRVQQVESGWGESPTHEMTRSPDDMLTCMPAEEAQLFGRVVRDKYLMSTASQHVPDWFAPFVFQFKECRVKDFVPRLEAGYAAIDKYCDPSSPAVNLSA